MTTKPSPRQRAEEDLAEATIPGSPAVTRARATDPGIIIEGMDSPDVWVKVARCCTPVPGDQIIGFITRGSGISVHRSDCGNVEQLRNEPERIIKVSWSKKGVGVFLVQIQVEALDRTGLLSEVTRVLSENHVNILSASSTTSRDRLATLRFTFEMADTEHMGHLLAAIRRIDGVFDAHRMMGNRKRSTEAPQN